LPAAEQERKPWGAALMHSIFYIIGVVVVVVVILSLLGVV
jgi:hypothetical protein